MSSNLIAGRTSLAVPAAAIIVAVSIAPARAAIDAAAAIKKMQAAFDAADADGDHKLSEEEYVARPGSNKVQKRDFHLFDFDGNGSLSVEEFSVTPGVIHPSLRGPVPDPFDDILAAATDAMNESFDDWSRTPGRQVQSQNFVIEFLRSISTDGRVSYDAELIRIADPNGSRSVDWKEAQRFMEVQLGIRTPSGVLIREPSGRVLLYHRFLAHDANRDGKVQLPEFLDKVKRKDAEELFHRGDLDGDGEMSLEETADSEWIGYADPIAEFRKADADFDGLVDLDELKAATPEWRKSLIPRTLPTFDADSDGKLSLTEYRVSMMGNQMCPWQSLKRDKNRDRVLRLDEFTFPRQNCRLLWRYYFFRFDTDHNNVLTSQEFPFEQIPPQMFHRMTVDGKDFRLLYMSEEYPFCGSPAMSPDGRWILFDGFPPKGIGGSRVFVMTIDGKDRRDLGPGLMPTWSPDGKRYACSRNDDYGVWIMNIDGSVERKIDDGWGAQWSPDGKSIAYEKSNTVWVHDVGSGENHEVLGKGGHPYRSIYYNMAWSPDSRRLLFKAYKTSYRESDVVSIRMAGESRDLKVHLSGQNNPDADMAWYPDGKHVLLSMFSSKHMKYLPHKLNVETGEPPEVAAGLDLGLNYHGLTISPDGKWIVMCTTK